MSVVDDDPTMTRLVGLIAEDLGYQVSRASSVKEFFSHYEAVRPDVIVSDIVMPETDGIELVQMLAQRECKASLILISGYEGKYLEITGKLAEFSGLRVLGVLEKPVTVDDMERVLRKALFP